MRASKPHGMVAALEPDVGNRGAAMIVRSAEAAELDHLAKLWYDGWQDAHARIVSRMTAGRSFGRNVETRDTAE